jgi:predicted ArsR family transcriptional regulator
MLTTILQKMAVSAVLNRADLAKQLGISEDLLERMLEDLARKGYLTSLAAAGGENHHSCGGCSSCKSCTAGSAGHNQTFTGWTLTAKGRAAAARLRS